MQEQPITLEMVRVAAQTLGRGGKEVTACQIYDALALTTPEEEARARNRISNMVKHGEVSRAGNGIYIYNFDKRPRNPRTFSAIWRFVRKAKPGWSLNDVSLMTRVSYRQILRYCDWLLEEGYIALHGKSRQTRLYRATAKADASPETPYPPLRDVDPFEKEKSAAIQITNAMMKQDPYAAKTANIIVSAARVLLARFENTVTEDENEGE